MAADESLSISENSKWSIQNRFEIGTFKISYPPYGYDWNGDQMVINPKQAKTIKQIFTYALSGQGTSAIARRLNEDQVPTKKGGHWNATTVKGILRNEKYTGDCLFQKTYTDSFFNRHHNHEYYPHRSLPHFLFLILLHKSVLVRFATSCSTSHPFFCRCKKHTHNAACAFHINQPHTSYCGHSPLRFYLPDILSKALFLLPDVG